jgi:protein TonB
MSPDSRKQKLRYVPALVMAVTVLVLSIGLFLLVQNWMSAPTPASKPIAQEVRIIRPPPPPPKVEEPPPPEEDVDVPEPEPEPDPSQPDDAPPGEQLGLDADGVAGGDGFGLAARKGGRDLLASNGSAYAWYAGVVKNEILQLLADDQRIRRGSYSVPVRVWILPDGSIDRVRLAQSTGDADRDRAIEQALEKLRRFTQAPPEGMPQPLSVRLVSRA